MEEAAVVAKVKNAADKNRKAKKEKMEYYREMLTQKIVEDPLHAVKREKEEVTKELFESIDKKIKNAQYMQECYDLLKEKLIKQERKATKFGLTGSMLFKLKANTSFDSSLKKLNFKDSKLMIYDVLKNKHNNYKQEVARSNEKVEISREEFMELAPLQIAGIIELKGGFDKIKYKKLHSLGKLG